MAAVVVRKRTSGTEADRIVNELARVMDAAAGVTVTRQDGETLVLGGADRDTVDQALDAISMTWPVHVGLE